MRMRKAWIVARKDFSEFRANKHIIATLAMMPILMSVFSVLIAVPLASLASQEPPPEPDLHLNLLVFYDHVDLKDTTLNNAWVNFSTVLNGIVNVSYINNSTLTNVIAYGSLLDNVSIANGILIGCVLRNSQYGQNSTVMIDTVISGTTTGSRELYKSLLDLMTHSFLLYFFFIMAVAMPTTIASYSFVGEKTNKTLEPLLSTPLTDGELLFGKYIAVFVPVMSLILVAFAIMTALIDLLTAPLLGYLLIPDAVWLVGVFVLTPIICIVGIAMNVYISSKVNDVRTAQQYSALIVLPVLLVFVIGPVTGMGSITVGFMTIIAIAFLGVLAFLVWLNLRRFNREDILTSWK